MRTRVAVALSTLLALAFLPGTPTHAATLEPSAVAKPNPAVLGAFGAPFQEPGPKCSTKKVDGQKTKVCLPAAVSVVVLPDHRILYWDGLEGFENIQHGTATEAGDAAINDQSRVLTLGTSPSWAEPTPVDGGANTNGYPNDYLFPNAP